VDFLHPEALVKPGYLAAGVGLLAVLTWKAALEAPDGQLHLYLLEAGKGNASPALLVGMSTGRYLLIGGELSNTDLIAELGRWLPLFGRRLDWWVIANSQVNDELPDACLGYFSHSYNILRKQIRYLLPRMSYHPA
jgi:hypothetical protein